MSLLSKVKSLQIRIICKLSAYFFVALLSAAAVNPGYASGDGHDHGQETGKKQKPHTESKNHKEKPGGHSRKEEPGGHGEENTVTIKPESLRAQGIIIKAVVPRSLGDVLSVPTEIKFNERRREIITARSSGWVKKVRVFNNQRVRKYQYLASIYSPDFLSAQQEYMLIVNRAKFSSSSADKENQALLDDARQRLRIFGLTHSEIKRLGETGKAFAHQHIHSPINGIVIEHKINAGDTIEPGQKLYVIADLRTVWAQISLTETLLGRVRRGQTVILKVKAYPKQNFRGRIVSIGASVDESTRTVKARALIINRRYLLKPGMFATANIHLKGGKPVMAVPQAAVLRSPDGDWIVLVEKQAGQFKAEEIKRIRTVGRKTVIEGLKPGTRVVVKGAFFIQSELAKSGFSVHNH
jgi:membrane fusion protein, heavy metal efflux system